MNQDNGSLRGALMGCAMVLGVSVTPLVRADILNVTRMDDPVPNGCDGDCSLREAIIASNASAAADTINLPAGTYMLTRAGAVGVEDIDPSVGDLDLASGGVSINGAGSESTIIDATGLAHRAFSAHIDLVFLPTAISISGLTIRGGNTTGLSAALNRGGGMDIGSRHATVSLTDVKVTQNTASAGGGIYTNGTLNVTNCSIASNSGTGITQSADGSNFRTVTISSSTMSANSLTGMDVNAGTCNITNTTISGNGSGGFTGGVDYGGGLTGGTITNATIANNRYGYIGQNDFAGDPGVTVRNSIIAGSTVRDVFTTTDAAFARAPTSGGNNIIRDNSGTTFTHATDQRNTNPLLHALALNPPGATETHALQLNSPAINMANASFAPPTDQRGVARPVGAADDIGAYELIPPDNDGDGFSPPDDCDDDDPARFPGATETIDDGIDQDCNGFDTVTCFVDADSDGTGSISIGVSADGDCNDPGESDVNTDCDDANAAIGSPTTIFEDADSDGFGDPDSSIVDCPQHGYVANSDDLCPSDSDKNQPGTCGCGVAETDGDTDGTPDCSDLCPSDPLKIAPGTCGCGTTDIDDDNDGTPNCHDQCPNDFTKTAPGACGCGTSDADSDGDGHLDCEDGCPGNSSKTSPGVCGCGAMDADSDGDGTLDCLDGCPTDPLKTDPGSDGCESPDFPANGTVPASEEDSIPAPQPTTDSDLCSNPLVAFFAGLGLCGAGCPLMLLGAIAGLAGLSGRVRNRT